MVLSHLGRPKEGQFDAGLVAGAGRRLARREAGFTGAAGSATTSMASRCADGEVVVLENCRMNVGEGKDDEALSKKYAALCDIFVMDAFGTAHRAQASTHGVIRFAPVAAAGPLLGGRTGCAGQGAGTPGPPAAGDRRRLQGLDQADPAGEPDRQGRPADRRWRHRQYLHRRRWATRSATRWYEAGPDRCGEEGASPTPSAAAPRCRCRSTWWSRRSSPPTAPATVKPVDQVDRWRDDPRHRAGDRQALRRADRQGRHRGLERPGRRVRVRRVRQGHRDTGPRDRRLQAPFRSPAVATPWPRSTSTASPTRSPTSPPAAARSWNSSRARNCPPSRRSRPAPTK